MPQLPSDSGLPASVLTGKRVAFIGKLGGITKREALRMVRNHKGTAVERLTAEFDLLVIGADQPPMVDAVAKLPDSVQQRIQAGEIIVWDETELWQHLGLTDSDEHSQQLYTPAMLADLLGLSVYDIRRWARRGLITPVREVHRLPYFDFQEVALAKQVAGLIQSGADQKSIERQLEVLQTKLAAAGRPLSQLSLSVDGHQVLLRAGRNLTEPGGQFRIDFDALESGDADPESFSLEQWMIPLANIAGASSSADSTPTAPKHLSRQEMIQEAERLDEVGELEAAVDWYRTTMAFYGPDAATCFQVAELLYRIGELTAARERYFMAIELDDQMVEARANLGCVLMETGRTELALASFEGALSLHPDYADAHYHMAEALEELGQNTQAIDHWAKFLELAPNSPWADHAAHRLAILRP